jgi:gluconolactonase
MKPKVTIVILWIFLEAVVAFGQAPGGQTPAPTDTTAPDIPGVVKGGTKVHIIKTGLQGTEAPIANPDGTILFTEQNANRITKIDKDDNFSTYVEDTKRTVGLGYDKNGRLIGASQEGAILVLAPTRAVLADTYNGQHLARPNDLTIDKKGGVYFSDPVPAPAAQPAAAPAPGALPPLPPPPPGRKSELLYIQPDGKVVLANDVERPNGVILSKDEKTLYATNREFLLAFDVQPDGSLHNRRTFANLVGLSNGPDGQPVGGGDGLIIDDAGRLYTCTGTGVQVFSPQGKYLGTIPTPLPPQNIAFGGPEKKTLYIVGRGVASKLPMEAKGLSTRAR